MQIYTSILSIVSKKRIRSLLGLITVLLVCFATGLTQAASYEVMLSKNDLVWTTVSPDFYDGAFIGDGIQGAMIMEDDTDSDGIRMLMGHYKAVAHSSISGWEYVNSRIFAGDILITPIGKAGSKTMRLDLWNGRAIGRIKTNRGQLDWEAFSDRQHRVFAVRVSADIGEQDAILNTREQWGITPRIYLENKDPDDYAAYLPPLPVVEMSGETRIITQKNRTRGAHVVASRLIPQSDGSRVLFVAIGVDDQTDRDAAALAARTDALNRLQQAVTAGYTSLKEDHQTWWHAFWNESRLEIQQDPEWQQFWYLQLYKFACASASDSSFLIDTQGPWIWKTAWAGVWYNLNVQLSYFPAFSANKLEVGRSLISGVDRIYASGALRSNAGNNGITLGRSGTYEGYAGWGDEYGNLPWLLHCYWKYWKYSGDDDIGRALFPMMKESATYLISKLTFDGTAYHVKPSRSPEYTEDLYADANYALMSIDWTLRTLLDMDSELGMNDPQRTTWQNVLNQLTPFPQDSNGFRVSSDQGFDKSHRHYSHLLAIYPYHTINPDQGSSQTTLIRQSVDRFTTLTGGQSGYTQTGAAAMYATLGDAEKAITTLDKLKGYLKPNTMYGEGGGPVIETPLSAVESINYMLLQSWNGIIRIFPAAPLRWQNVVFENFLTEGAFLVSARRDNQVIGELSITSKAGRLCMIKNPWPGQPLNVRSASGLVTTSVTNEVYSFPTVAGETYTLSAAGDPEITEAAVLNDAPDILRLKLSETVAGNGPFTGFTVRHQGLPLQLLSVQKEVATGDLLIQFNSPATASQLLTVSYTGQAIQSIHGDYLQPFDNLPVDNLLAGAAPRLIAATLLTDGQTIRLTFNQPIQSPATKPGFTIATQAGSPIPFSQASWLIDQPEHLELELNTTVYRNTPLTLSYTGEQIQSQTAGQLTTLTDFPVVNQGPGVAPFIIGATVTEGGAVINLQLDQPVDVRNQHPYFSLTRNTTEIAIKSLASDGNSIKLTPASPIRAGDSVTLSYQGGQVETADQGKLPAIDRLSVTNPLTEPTYKPVTQRIEAEHYSAMVGVRTEGCGDVGGGQNLGYIDAGDWIEYALYAEKAGNYPLYLRFASAYGGGRANLLDTYLKPLASVTFPTTGGWQTWQTYTNMIYLPEGDSILRIAVTGSGFNLNYLEFGTRQIAWNPATYEQWRASIFSAGEIAAGLADPQRALTEDGIPNFTKYAMGIENPFSDPSRQQLPALTQKEDGHFYYEYPSPYHHLNYTVETTTNLSSGWIPYREGPPEETFSSYSVDSPTNTLFIRLKISD
jgi:alpha-L-fucosidase 2